MTRRCVTDEQYGKLWRRIDDLVRRIDEGTISYKTTMEEIQKWIEGTVKPAHDIVVDYSRSLNAMIKAGNYDWVDSDINSEHFPLKGKGKHELTATLFHFDRFIVSDDAIAEMDKQGYRPGLNEELLFLGEKYPALQKEFPIVALGSVWRDPYGFRSVPSLRWSGLKRRLYLCWFDTGWYAYYRFLALRK